jgi:hypothetical protein
MHRVHSTLRQPVPLPVLQVEQAVTTLVQAFPPRHAKAAPGDRASGTRGPEIGLGPGGNSTGTGSHLARRGKCGDLATGGGERDELHQTDDRRSGHDEARASCWIAGIGLDDLGLPSITSEAPVSRAPW